MEACDLAAEFGTNGAGRAGDHYDLAVQCGTDGGSIERNGNAAEEVLDVDVADMGGQAVAFDDFPEAGYGLVGNAGFVAMLQDVRHLRAGGGGHGDEDGFNGLRRHDRGQICAAAKDFHAADEATGLRRVVVDEAYGLVGECGIALDLAEQGDTGVTGAINERTFAGTQIRHSGKFDRYHHCQADSCGHSKAKEEIQYIDRPRETLGNDPH